MSIDGWQVPQVYNSPESEAGAVRERVGLADLSACGKLIVRGDAARDLLADGFGLAPPAPGLVSPAFAPSGTGPPAHGIHAAGLTSDEFLAITPPGEDEDAAQALEERRVDRRLFVSVVNQTSGLAGLLVAGPQARAMLRKLSALPLSADDFGDRRVAQGSLAKVHVIIMRIDFGPLPTFELYVERPYAEYVWASLMDAGEEFGITPFGWEAKALLAME